MKNTPFLNSFFFVASTFLVTSISFTDIIIKIFVNYKKREIIFYILLETFTTDNVLIKRKIYSEVVVDFKHSE